MSKQRKDKTKKYIDRAIKKSIAEANNGTTIQDCHFVGVEFDARAVSAIQTIADGLVENAKALSHLALLLKASNVHVDAMVRIEQSPERD